MSWKGACASPIFIPLKALTACSERGCVFPGKWLVLDIGGASPMCTTHRDSVICGHSIEDRSTPFDTLYGVKGTGERTSLHGAHVSSKDWFECTAFHYEKIPSYLYEEVASLARAGIATRAIARLIGYDRSAVRRLISARFPEAMDATCKCGLSRRHQGWCKVRFANSPLRKAVIRLLHVKRFAVAASAKGFSPESIRDAIRRQFCADGPTGR